MNNTEIHVSERTNMIRKLLLVLGAVFFSIVTVVDLIILGLPMPKPGRRSDTERSVVRAKNVSDTYFNVVGWAALVEGYDAESIYQLQRKEPKTEAWANAFAPGHAFTIMFFVVLSVFLWKRALSPKGNRTEGEDIRDA